MGPPLITSIDKTFFYPCVVSPTAVVFRYTHPITITSINVVVKMMCLLQMYLHASLPSMMMLQTCERYLDCLDGEIARRYDKCTWIGHLMDKTSDFVYRVLMSALLLQQSQCDASWYAFVWVCVLLFIGVYIYDTIRGTVVNGHATLTSYAIVLEDNATLLCVIIPYVSSCINDLQCL
jgi:phosphatidylglycerophosphate synthase